MHTFSLDKIEQDRLNLWLIDHIKTCRFGLLLSGINGGCLTYSFTPGSQSLVVEIKVTCACGSKTDVTNTDIW